MYRFCLCCMFSFLILPTSTASASAATGGSGGAAPTDTSFDLEVHFHGLILFVPANPNSTAAQTVTVLGVRADDIRDKAPGNRQFDIPGHVPFLRVDAGSYCKIDAPTCTYHTEVGGQPILIPLDGDEIAISAPAETGTGVTLGRNFSTIPALRNASPQFGTVAANLLGSIGTPGDSLALRMVLNTGTLDGSHLLQDSGGTAIQWSFKDYGKPPTISPSAPISIEGGAVLEIPNIMNPELTVTLTPLMRGNKPSINHIDMMTLKPILPGPRSFRLARPPAPMSGNKPQALIIEVLNMPASNILNWDNSYRYDINSIEHFQSYYLLTQGNTSQPLDAPRLFPVVASPGTNKDGKPYCSDAVASPPSPQ